MSAQTHDSQGLDPKPSIPGAQVEQPGDMLQKNAWERTMADWLRRADEANREAALEAKRNHTHQVHSILGGKSILSDKEITMPEDELASQV